MPLAIEKMLQWVWGFLDATYFDRGLGQIESEIKLQVSFFALSKI
jgi:hypothetical protein